MKKIILVAAALALLVGASTPVRLARITVANKSGYEAAIWLSEYQSDRFPEGAPELNYYLTAEKGSRLDPRESVWTIVPGEYLVRFSYLANGIEIYTYAERLSLGQKTKIILLPPSKSGQELCREKYESGKQLQECLDGLYGVKYLSESVWKYLPTLWLSRMQP